ncbi:DNA-binding transcriptional regulator, LysR family [Lutimaribacter pacificus]|uniref:Transcriptional regulator, LysR family n=1 Tax=Lutimaribacter pacificus TaxID=391948 RepID=A0A1H0MBK1_9RHOB|nr:LysR family transcriptional regulator [Lutimaribacter pacificus]SDO77774.1 DNA-binding transcriptional regulator, LysR family [Lutimaribacter pacificus]SHK99281.1 transcriptional regulator, LysR family [Lutimaribacter pacificus]
MNGLDHLDFNLLKVFDAIYQEGSVSRAAERLNLSQPATSNALNRLRTTLGDQLFVRTRDGMEPTVFARSIAEPVQRGLMGITSSIVQNMSFDPVTSDRRFTVLATDVGAATYVAALMRILREAAPNINLRVMEAPWEQYENLLEFGTADFALGRAEISDRFVREHIADTGFSAILCAKYAREIGVTPGSVIPYDLYLSLQHVRIWPRVTVGIRHPIDKALGDDAGQCRIVLTLPHSSVLTEFIPDSPLVATVTSALANSLCQKAEMIEAKLPFVVEPDHVLMIWHRRHQLDKGHAWMREQIRTLPRWPWNMLQDTGETKSA